MNLDELDAHIAESMKDPEYAAAVKAAEEREARLVQSECSERNCVVLTDPQDPEYEAGWGPVGCPCQDDGATSDPVSRVQAIEAAEDHADQVVFDAWRERGL